VTGSCLHGNGLSGGEFHDLLSVYKLLKDCKIVSCKHFDQNSFIGNAVCRRKDRHGDDCGVCVYHVVRRRA
jgi:hypothetical protein